MPSSGRSSTAITSPPTSSKAGLAELRTEQRTGVAELRTEIANVESRLIKWVVGTAVAAAVAGAGITTVLLRLLGG